MEYVCRYTRQGKNFVVFYFVDRVIMACIRTENVLFLIFFVKKENVLFYGRMDGYTNKHYIEGFIF